MESNRVMSFIVFLILLVGGVIILVGGSMYNDSSKALADADDGDEINDAIEMEGVAVYTMTGGIFLCILGIGLNILNRSGFIPGLISPPDWRPREPEEPERRGQSWDSYRDYQRSSHQRDHSIDEYQRGGEPRKDRHDDFIDHPHEGGPGPDRHERGPEGREYREAPPVRGSDYDRGPARHGSRWGDDPKNRTKHDDDVDPEIDRI